MDDDTAELIGALAAEIVATRYELGSQIGSTRDELKADIASTKNELGAEIASTKNELRAEIASTKNELKAEIAALDVRFNDLKRHTEVLTESVRDDIRLVAEAVAHLAVRFEARGL